MRKQQLELSDTRVVSKNIKSMHVLYPILVILFKKIIPGPP